MKFLKKVHKKIFFFCIKDTSQFRNINLTNTYATIICGPHKVLSHVKFEAETLGAILSSVATTYTTKQPGHYYKSIETRTVT